jgi:hypothetical protein
MAERLAPRMVRLTWSDRSVDSWWRGGFQSDRAASVDHSRGREVDAPPVERRSDRPTLTDDLDRLTCGTTVEQTLRGERASAVPGADGSWAESQHHPRSEALFWCQGRRRSVDLRFFRPTLKFGSSAVTRKNATHLASTAVLLNERGTHFHDRTLALNGRVRSGQIISSFQKHHKASES